MFENIFKFNEIENLARYSETLIFLIMIQRKKFVLYL